MLQIIIRGELWILDFWVIFASLFPIILYFLNQHVLFYNKKNFTKQKKKTVDGNIKVIVVFYSDKKPIPRCS